MPVFYSILRRRSPGARGPARVAKTAMELRSCASVLLSRGVKAPHAKTNKPFPYGDLVAAVRDALAMDEHTRKVRLALASIQRCLDTLTPREYQVLRHVVEGRLNKQIAADLGIADKTIKVHRARAMEKMGAGSLAELVRKTFAVEVGALLDDRQDGLAACPSLRRIAVPALPGATNHPGLANRAASA